MTVPNTTPTKEHYQFAGWCKDLALTDCDEFQTIQSGTSGDITFYAKWIATACPAGQYLDSGKCSNCPTDFISNAWMATNPADCYYDCNTLCPDNATCTFAGITDGLIHYGSGQEISSCSTNMAFECNLGYTKSYAMYTKSYAIYNECLPDEYYINYFNTRDSYWGVGSIHPESYTVQNSRIIISAPMRDHYNFDGWCIDEDNCDTPVKSFVIDPTTTLRNMNLYAQWSEKEFVCDSGKFLHIGDDTACLSTIKRTSPALGIGKGNKKYYLNMAYKHNGTTGLNINKESNKQINVLYNGTLYNVHDDSIVTK